MSHTIVCRLSVKPNGPSLGDIQIRLLKRCGVSRTSRQQIPGTQYSRARNTLLIRKTDEDLFRMSYNATPDVAALYVLVMAIL